MSKCRGEKGWERCRKTKDVREESAVVVVVEMKREGRFFFVDARVRLAMVRRLSGKLPDGGGTKNSSFWCFVTCFRTNFVTVCALCLAAPGNTDGLSHAVCAPLIGHPGTQPFHRSIVPQKKTTRNAKAVEIFNKKSIQRRGTILQQYKKTKTNNKNIYIK